MAGKEKVLFIQIVMNTMVIEYRGVMHFSYVLSFPIIYIDQPFIKIKRLLKAEVNIIINNFLEIAS